MNVQWDVEEDDAFDVETDADGNLIDFLSGRPLVAKPEERVRQHYLRVLHLQYGYPRDVMAREVPIQHGSGQARDEHGRPKFADIVVYESAEDCRTRNQGGISFVVENKAPDETTGHNQLVSYIFLTSANGAVWYNGREARWYRRFSVPQQSLVPWPGLPRFGEAWDAVGRRSKAALKPLLDVRTTLERCHNKLHRRGSEGEDLTMDMVRILLAKARDEERDDPNPMFYCTPEEYADDQGREAVATRVQQLFQEVRDANRTVFESTERITVGIRQIAEVVVELQDFRLIGDDDTQWDIMGAAYEQYTAEILKREGGEFFTNRLVVQLLTRMTNPRPDHTVLDPAGGTGGFLTAAIRHMRAAVRGSTATDAVKQRRIDQIRDRLFYIDIKHRLVKIAKAAMILTGNGHRGFTQGDSLAPPSRLPDEFRARIGLGEADRVLTNPPFAGTTNGKIDAPSEMVPQFELAQRWQWQEGQYIPTGEPLPGGVPPELLFIERCIQWLKPGGVVGIVVPKGVLENPDVTLAARHFIFRHTLVRAVVACHKNTFQPYTGSRTALLVLEKKRPEGFRERDEDYPIFMAVSRKIGQDSEGEPIYVRDRDGQETDQIDHDLDQIYEAWLQHTNGTLESSEYTFEVRRSDIDPRTLRISPQAFLPSLNEAIADVVRLGETDSFTVTPLGEIAEKIYKGTRFKREDLETDVEGPDVVRYFTPGALLQDRAESVKFWDLSKISARRRRELERHLLKRFEVLVTRSGTVGRVILTTADHAGHVGSDDLIHIEIDDEVVRAFVYQYLKSELGQKQMMRDEYGTIQQHLEPAHLREVLIPLPTNAIELSRVHESVVQALNAKEESLQAERNAGDILNSLIEAAKN